jgi:hypothetical protein
MERGVSTPPRSRSTTGGVGSGIGPLGRAGAVLVAAVVLGALAGCAPRPQTGAPPPTAGARPRSTATVAIASPVPGEEITGRTLHVRIRLTGGVIVPQTSTQLSPDKGHVHLSLDGKVVSMSYGVTQDVPVTPGVHILTAEFVATDHFPFNPRVLSTITFTVK